MFRNSYQSGFLSVLYSVGSQPLSIWEPRVKNGHIKRTSDPDIRSQVVEIVGTNVATTYIFCPQDPKVSLGVKLKFLVMIIKNLNKYFSFEVTILDNTHTRRRFRASNYQSTTRVRPFSCSMPMSLNPGWNQVQFDLADFTRRAYGTEYMETTRIQIHANIRIRRVYFADQLYTEDDVPPDYRLYVNDDPRTRRFSEPATAMTSAALTAAAMAGGSSKPIDCSGIAAAPPTPCGGDVIPEEIPLPEEKLKSFIGAPPPVSAEILPSLTNQVSFHKDKVSSLTRHSSLQAPASVAASKPPSLSAAGSKSPTVSASGAAPSVTAAGSKTPTVIASGAPASSVTAAGSKAPIVSASGAHAPSVTAGGSKTPIVSASGAPAPSFTTAGSLGFVTGSKPPSVTAASSQAPVPGSKAPSDTTGASMIPMVGSKLTSVVNAAYTQPSQMAAGSQAIMASQQASLTAAVSPVASPAPPASAEKMPSFTDGETPE